MIIRSACANQRRSPWRGSRPAGRLAASARQGARCGRAAVGLIVRRGQAGTVVAAIGILSLAFMLASGRGIRRGSGTAGSALEPAAEAPEVVPLERLVRGPGEGSGQNGPAC